MADATAFPCPAVCSLAMTCQKSDNVIMAANEQEYRHHIESVCERARWLTSQHTELDFMDTVHTLLNLDLSPSERLRRSLEASALRKFARSGKNTI